MKVDGQPLDLVVRSGLVRELDFGEGFKRYEPGAAEGGGGGGQPHEHCVYRLEIYGLCRECQQSNPLARAR